jgi:hypothetical protein
VEGRDVARRVTDSALAGALAGRGRLVLVTGEAGIGKTTLARSVADLAEAGDAQVRWAACWDGGSLLPFGAWIDALRRPGGDRCGAIASRLADATEQAPDAAAATRARARLFADVLDALEEAASSRPQVVVLEDVHWADAPTLELVRAVAPHLPSMAALVVATYRDDELDAEAELAGIGGAAEWLTLDGLSARDVATLLAEVLGREPSSDEVHSVHGQTGGNPLFVTQVARLLAAGAPAAVPAGVRDVLARRLARLSPAADRVLAVAAVLGTAFDVQDVVAISGASEDEVFATLDEAARARLAHAVDERPDRWSFVHDLVRATRYERLGPADRADLHRRALDALDARATTPAGVLAHHAGRARFEPGDVRPAALAVAAAHEALARLAWPEALALCERALDVAPDGADGDLWRIEAMLAAGDARLRTGDDGGAAHAFGQAAAAARRHERWDLLARAALGFAAGLASFEVPLMERRQIALLEEAVAILPGDSPLRPLVLARLSVALSLMGTDDRRLRLADEAVRLARTGDDVAALASAIAARCDAIAGPDHVTERLGAATEIVALAQRVDDVGLELLGRRHRIVALLELRDLLGFDAEVAAFASGAERLGDPLYSWCVPLWQAMRAEAAGRLDDAEDLAREARSIGTSGGSANAAMLERVVALCIASDRGDVAGLDTAARDVLAAYPDLVTPPLRHIVTGWVDAEAGRLDGVRRDLAELARTDLALLPRDQEWLASLAQLVMAAAAVGDRPVLEAAYEHLLPYAGLGCFEGVAAIDRGVVDRFLALAAGHLGDLAAVERHAPAALAGGEAAGALVAAHTAADCARAFAATGASARAAELAADAAGRYEALGLDHRAAPLRRLAALSPPAPDAGVATLVREGEAWAFTFDGTTARVRHAKGIADLAVLLANGPREVHVRTLEGVDGAPATAAQPALDDTAVAAYRARVRDLEAELDDADRRADDERSSRLAAERDAIVEELTRGLGLGGRRRSAGSDPDERLRKAVSARVRASIDRLEALHPALGLHLRHAVRTGYWCSYAPERPVTWHVERHGAR